MSRASEWRAIQPAPFAEVGLQAWVDPDRGVLLFRATTVREGGASSGMMVPEAALRFARWILDTFAEPGQEAR